MLPGLLFQNERGTLAGRAASTGFVLSSPPVLLTFDAETTCVAVGLAALLLREKTSLLVPLAVGSVVLPGSVRRAFSGVVGSMAGIAFASAASSPSK